MGRRNWFLILRQTAFLLVVLVSATQGICEDKVLLRAGHVVGNRGSVMVADLFGQISKQLPGIDVTYDEKSTDQGDGEDRFRNRQRLADLIFLYAGSTANLDEVSSLAKAGWLQPVDDLPGVSELLQSGDIYENLLEPVSQSGRVWAIPVRVVVPVLAVRREIKLNPGEFNWEKFFTLAYSHQATPSADNDYYLLWRTLMEQCGHSPFVNGRVRTPDELSKNNFEKVQTLYGSPDVVRIDSADICLANSDTLADYPQLLTEFNVYPLPALQDETVYCSAWTWYLGISSSLIGVRRDAAAQVILAILSPNVQIEISLATMSTPPLQSIARQLESHDDTMKAIVSTTPRLRFRQPDKLSQLVEVMIEHSFRAALETPDSFRNIMAAAADNANALIDTWEH